MATRARLLIKEQSPELHSRFFDLRKRTELANLGYCVIYVSGSSEPLLDRLLECSYRTLNEYGISPKKVPAIAELENLQQRVEKRVGRLNLLCSYLQLRRFLSSCSTVRSPQESYWSLMNWASFWSTRHEMRMQEGYSYYNKLQRPAFATMGWRSSPFCIRRLNDMLMHCQLSRVKSGQKFRAGSRMLLFRNRPNS